MVQESTKLCEPGGMIVSYEACPECGGMIISHSYSGERVCSKCGLVAEQKELQQMTKLLPFDVFARSYPGERPALVDGIGSDIGYWRQKSFHQKGREPPEYQHLCRKLVMLHKITRTENKEVAFTNLLKLNRIASKLGLSRNVKEQAAYYFKKVGHRTLPGQKNKMNSVVTMAICLLVAVREFGGNAPVRVKDIVKAVVEDGGRMSIRLIVRYTPMVESILGIRLTRRKSEDFLPKIISDLLTQETVENKEEYASALRVQATLLLQSLPSNSRNPYLLAVSCVYEVARRIAHENGFRLLSGLTQKSIAQTLNVNDYSIREILTKFVRKEGKCLQLGESLRLNIGKEEGEMT